LVAHLRGLMSSLKTEGNTTGADSIHEGAARAAPGVFRVPRLRIFAA
jgi:hypothetical protein